MGYVKIGTAHTFSKVDATKPFALKIAEETCEVYSAFENYRDAASTMRAKERKKLLLEIADVITACAISRRRLDAPTSQRIWRW